VSCITSDLPLNSGGVGQHCDMGHPSNQAPLSGRRTFRMQAAARFDDPIAHSSAESGLITGALIGAGLVILGAVIVGTGGAALPLVIGAVLTGAALGGWIGEFAGSLSFFNKISGKIASGSPNVFVNNKRIARAVADIGECSKHGPEPQQIATGSETVFINKFHAARVDDKLQCSGFIVGGSPDVFIGGGQARYTAKELESEVAWYYHALVFGAGIAGALLLGGWAAVPGIVGAFGVGYVGGEVMGLVGRYYGDWLSENIGGKPSDWEKSGRFVGQAIGGWLGAKGGMKGWESVKTKYVAARRLKTERQLDEMYAVAPKAKVEIDALADSIAMESGGKVAKAPLKGRARAMEKAIKDYDGDATQIKDLARNTIIVEDQSQYGKAVNLLRQHGAKIKTHEADTNPMGYSGTNSTIKTEAGIYGEIQVNTPEMIYAKELPPVAKSILGEEKYAELASKPGMPPAGRGHQLYEEWRSLPEGDPRRDSLQVESRAYHDQVRRIGGK
jgi:uncharacterized Zn-binding protein involved in type VI secretion